MRIISQDGTIDIPYDLFSLSIVGGRYKDVEYVNNLVFQFPKDEEVK